MNLTTYRPTTSIEFLDASASTSGSITAAVRQISGRQADSIREQLGLNQATVLLQARLSSPKRLPDTVKAGHRAALTWAGRDGVARLTPYQYNLATQWRDKYGDSILLAWQTDEVT